MLGGELLIVGAGPSGLALSASYAGPSRIIEQEGEVGGLCRSIEFGGSVFDIGGHCFHTPYPEVRRMVENLMQGRWEVQRRDARIFFDGGELIPYPFQQHLDQIADAAVADECRSSMPATHAAAGDAEDFQSWIVQRFGAGVARHFMLPYNRKLWARDLSRMSREWVGERVADSSTTQSAETVGSRAPLSAETMVGYPADGGFVEIFRAMAGRAGPIEFNQRLVAVDLAGRAVRTASGALLGWGRLVSTIPLPMLLRCIANCPANLIREAGELEYVSLKLVMIAAERAPGRRPQRLYVAAPEVPAHKIAFNHESSAALRQRPREAVMCEVSYSPFKPGPSDADLERIMVDWLVERGLIAGAAEVRILDVPLAYPVPTPRRRAIVERIRAWLEPHGIFTIGRFGAWAYANSDGCIMEAMRLAERL